MASIRCSVHGNTNVIPGQRHLLPASHVIRPSSVDQVADAIREVTVSGEWLVPVGGACSMTTGNVTSSPPMLLDLTELRGVEAYVPADLTLTVHAGTTIAELQQALAEHGQEIPVDAPFPERATIGGLVATGFAGPRRLAFGTLKDLVIGATFVRGDGLVAKAGGLVVKNVSGFEIPRLLHGSWGALAVIASVNLKVVPRPKSEATVVTAFSPTGRDAALAASRSLLEGANPLSAMTIEHFGDRIELAVRVTGHAGSVSDLVTIATEAIAGRDHSLRDGPASERWWQDQSDRWAGGSTDDGVQLAIGASPTNLERVLAAIDNGMSTNGPESLLIQPGTGSVRARFAEDDAVFRQWWIDRTVPGGQPSTAMTIETAPDLWREGLTVWGPRTSQTDLAMKLKNEFDPHGVLNRGRLFV